MEVRATWQLKMWQLSVSLSDDCGFCEGFFSATPSEHLKNHDTGGLEPWNFMNFHILGISSSLTKIVTPIFREKMAQPPVPIAPTAQAPRNPRRRGR